MAMFFPGINIIFYEEDGMSTLFYTYQTESLIRSIMGDNIIAPNRSSQLQDEFRHAYSVR